MLCENTTAILMTFTICKLKDLYTLSNLLESLFNTGTCKRKKYPSSCITKLPLIFSSLDKQNFQNVVLGEVLKKKNLLYFAIVFLAN